jgi:hypothetical protein
MLSVNTDDQRDMLKVFLNRPSQSTAETIRFAPGVE